MGGSLTFEKVGKVCLTTPVAEDRRPPLVTKTSREKVRKLITKDRQLTVRMKADELRINRESVRQIVTQNVGMRKTRACCNLILHHSIDSQKQARLEDLQARFHTANIVKQFLANIGIGEN
ncbi:hypothetical protein TNCV_3033821 [Trichonephila clavipes]|nr:hypothetical protein TNCV_3033821 [Trichonephila clavipes]